MTSETLSRPGTLIRARGREWVVLPESSDQLLVVRPIGGLDEEVTGILPSIELVESTSFSLPGRSDLGDFSSGRLLRDAARLSTRAAAGPFRSFGRIAVDPRPYQLVPLMMALKLNPVRLLIADDVGIGKTIEAGLIARELFDRGEIKRIAVLCPPQLAEQWQRELLEKFHIDAELILSSTILRLERDLPLGVSVFDRYRFTIVSMDFIKSLRHAEDFILKCPEFVIVDEAHGCTLTGGIGRGRHQRFDLLRRIAQDARRHLLLVTATPHSGNEEAFRSLLGLLDEEFSNLPLDLERAERAGIRRKLSQHLVQRRRQDIAHYLGADTAFPKRIDKKPELTYAFSKEYRALFDDILGFARTYVSEKRGTARHQRVRYWSALALLRCVSSSPAAAAATLRSRAAVDEAGSEDVEEVGRNTVLDQGDTDDTILLDFIPGSEVEADAGSTRRKLLEFARRAEGISPKADHKLQGAIREIKELVKDGYQPLVFCRFVDTAEYVARELRAELPPKVRVESVTGLLPPAEREARINALTLSGDEYVLICTDCLSEGINLQEHFNAVLHYDLAWNPTRHEQREGRVDRFGQPKGEVRVAIYYGTDNPIDGVILDVLIRKHKSIKNDLGVTVAIPGSSEQIVEALFEGALFRDSARGGSRQLTLDFIDELGPKKSLLHAEWDSARDREKATRSRFAQQDANPEAVDAELKSVRSSIGSSEDVCEFFTRLLLSTSVPFKVHDNTIRVEVDNGVPRSLRQAIGFDEPFSGRFELPLQPGDIYLGRTSPVIEGASAWVLDQALDPVANEDRPLVSRCGVISTVAVNTRTTLLIVRFRHHLQNAGSNEEARLCEEILALSCRGPADAAQWLSVDEAEKLLSAQPGRNLVATAINQQLDQLFEALPKLQASLEATAWQRAERQLAVHESVRAALRTKVRLNVTPVLPVDILAAYIMLPPAN